MSVDLSASRMSSHELRRWVRAALYREDEDCVEKVWLVLAELAADAHDHGWSPVVIRVWRSTASSVVRVEVEDAYRRVPVPGVSRCGGTRGFGLALVDGLARRWGVDVNAAGRTVWAELAGRAAEPGVGAVDRPPVSELPR